MKTRYPACLTVFRVGPEQLKVRAGKVRCGECNEVFNALDYLLNEDGPVIPPHGTTQVSVNSVDETNAGSPILPEVEPSFHEAAAYGSVERLISDEPATSAAELGTIAEDTTTEPSTTEEIALNTEAESSAPAAAENMEPLPVEDLILPRDTSQIPGYSKWAEGVMNGTTVSAAANKAPRWPFFSVAALLLILLAGQMAFYFRSKIVIVMPSLRPILESYSGLFDTNVPLPRHVELMSIEASDLQNDPAHGNLLVLNATLRNRANFVQEFPALELSLTDTQDAAIARRVFLPSDYLSDEARERPFAANGEVAVRLWIEAKEISAAGYRLYVFYP